MGGLSRMRIGNVNYPMLDAFGEFKLSIGSSVPEV